MSGAWGYSAQEKAACARREAGKRKAVYPKTSMPTNDAKREIGIMEAIAADYENFAALDPGLPLLDDKKRLVLFFANEVDREEFVRIYREAKPNAATIKV